MLACGNLRSSASSCLAARLGLGLGVGVGVFGVRKYERKRSFCRHILPHPTNPTDHIPSRQVQ